MITKLDIREAISHTTNGPVTPFALISRAMKIAVTLKQDNADIIAANALLEELQDRKMLK